MLVAAEQEIENTLQAEFRKLLFSKGTWQYLPEGWHTSKQRCYVFRALSRCLTSTEYFLRRLHEQLQYKIFLMLKDPSLAEVFGSADECEKDAKTRRRKLEAALLEEPLKQACEATYGDALEVRYVGPSLVDVEVWKTKRERHEKMYGNLFTRLQLQKPSLRTLFEDLGCLPLSVVNIGHMVCHCSIAFHLLLNCCARYYVLCRCVQTQAQTAALQSIN